MVAGLLHTAADWLAFADDWQAALDREPRLRLFKMSDVVDIKPVERRDEKLRQLAAVLEIHKPTVFLVAVDLDGLASTFGTILPPPVDHPYYHLFFGMIWHVARQLALCHRTEPFEIIYDEKLTHQDKVRVWYPNFIDTIGKLAADQGPTSIWPRVQRVLPVDPTFRKDDDFLPLQAADMYAWLLRKEILGSGREFAWLRDRLPALAWSLNMNRDFWRKVWDPPLGDREVIARLSDPDRYAELLRVRGPVNEMPGFLWPRRRAYEAWRYRTSPSAPQAPEPEPPGEPS